MGLISRLRKVTGKRVQESEARQRIADTEAEALLDAELEEGDPALRQARERVRALQAKTATKEPAPDDPAADDPPPDPRRRL